MAQSDPRKEFAETLVAAREAMGLSRRELASLAKTSHQTIRAFEEGEGNKIDILARVAGRVGFELRLEPARG